jgi:hypothetical protein
MPDNRTASSRVMVMRIGVERPLIRPIGAEGP